MSGEPILVPLASRGADIDSVFNLNPTGAFVWERIDGCRTGAEIATLMAGDFQVSYDQASADCTEFLGQLLQLKAIEFEYDTKE